MLKKTITYEDFNGQTQTEEFYFNLSKPELGEMLYSGEEGTDIRTRLQQIIAANDGGLIMAFFKDFIAKSVGIKSPDGKRFMKSPEIASDFLSTNAYSELFMELMTDPDASLAFVRAVIPSDISSQIDDTPALPEKKTYTEEELLSMDDTEFSAVVGTDEKNWTREQLLVAMKRRNRQPA